MSVGARKTPSSSRHTNTGTNCTPTGDRERLRSESAVPIEQSAGSGDGLATDRPRVKVKAFAIRRRQCGGQDICDVIYLSRMPADGVVSVHSTACIQDHLCQPPTRCLLALHLTFTRLKKLQD